MTVKATGDQSDVKSFAISFSSGALAGNFTMQRAVDGRNTEADVTGGSITTGGADAAIRSVTDLNIYEGLTKIDKTGAVQPDLATSWDISADGLSYTFHLKTGVKFNDGTPMTVALNQRLEEDKIATTSPGFGIAAAADGTRYPYLFPIAAAYWSQGAAAVQFVKDKLGGNLKGKKIAYIFYDNPAGHEPMPIIDELQKQEGFELRTFAVPPPGVEVGAQVLDITQRFRPDFVIAHLFGRSPAAAIKAFKANGYPLSKVVGLVWASSEADIDAAGGFGAAEGYHAMQFAGAGDDYPVRQQIKAMYKKEGKEPIKLMDENTVYYNRGLLQAAIHVEAIRNALKATGGKPPTGTDIKNGLEQIRDFTLDGLVPPLEITPTDHEGGGWVQVFQVHGGKFVKETDWFRAYRDVVEHALKTAE